MSTLYLDRRGFALRLEGRALVLYADRERQGTVPLHLLERVVMRSTVEIESGLLARLADAGISVLIFGGRNASKQAIVLPRSGNDAARRVGQYRRYEDADWRRAWSTRIVLGKLKGQMRLLRRALGERPDLRHPLTAGLRQLEQARARIAEDGALSIESLRGVEGAAAAAYFGCLARDAAGIAGVHRTQSAPPARPSQRGALARLHPGAFRGGAGLSWCGSGPDDRLLP